jgi:predicted AAA+ superfamily ATPase
MRRIYEQILKDHFQRNRQAAFVCGPRQVGKTTLVQQYAESQPYSLYLNWDRIEDRAKILSPKYANVLEGVPLTPAYKPVIIFDEIHKFKDWKNYVKGFIDTYEKDLQIIVTGSAKLNVFRKGGDSQMGRYLLYRVHPLTIGELGNRDPLALLSEPFSLSKEILNNLMQFGGFPEPFTKTDPRFFKQWQQLRDQQLIVEDIQGIEKIQQIAQLELLSYLLRSQVGQLVNYSNLASKVRVSDPTIRRWMTTLETFYYIFTLKPWSHNVARSLIKEPKVYLWD